MPFSCARCGGKGYRVEAYRRDSREQTVVLQCCDTGKYAREVMRRRRGDSTPTEMPTRAQEGKDPCPVIQLFGRG
jgi:hypothetical protein